MKARVSSAGGLAKLQARFIDAKGRAVAGVLRGAQNNETGKPVAEYARFLEYGTTKMPPRPFMRDTVAGHAEEWKAQLVQGIAARGTQSAREVLETVGRMMRADIVSTIRDGQFEPLADSTVRQKERRGRPEPGAPLIDTTSLIKSIGSEVRDL